MSSNTKLRRQLESIYNTVRNFVQQNKNGDDELYQNAILKLQDGRKIIVSFKDMIITINEVKVTDGKYDGSYFTIREGKKVTLVNYKKNNTPAIYELESTDLNNPLDTYLLELSKQLESLEYDKEATHSTSNYTPEARQLYNIRRYYSEIDKLMSINPENRVLPCVEAAINWWGEYVINAPNTMPPGTSSDTATNEGVTEQQIAAFKTTLSEKIMQRLSNGLSVMLKFDYLKDNILKEALKEANINIINIRLQKIQMDIDIDAVTVVDSHGFCEIYPPDLPHKIQGK